MLQWVELPDLEDLKLTVPIIERDDLEFTNQVLGEGGQATVEKGYWKKAALEVAIKNFCRSKVKDKGTLREIAMLNKIRHPNIVSILGVCRTQYTYHIVLDLFNGASLGDVLFGQLADVPSYRLTKKNKANILQQVLMAITFLHETLQPLVLHRDIKPYNILIQKRGIGFHTKLCDFGMAKSESFITSLRITDPGTIKGTKWYLAPEILIDRSEATTASDIWALGVTAVEMFTKNDFWCLLDLSDIIKRMERNDIPSAAGVPAPIFPIIQRCLSKDPSIRPRVSAVVSKMIQHHMWIN